MFYTCNLGDIFDYEADELWSKERLLSEIKARAAHYRSIGISSTDKVLIVHGNSAPFFADLFAVWSLGACAACLDSDVGHAEFSPIRDKCDARFVIGKGGLPPKLSEVDMKAFRFVDTSEIPAGGGDNLADPAAPVGHDLDSPALLLFTSGTTGDPKGVVHTFRTLMAKWTVLPYHMPLEHLDVSLCLLPTHFGHGLICNCLYPLVHGKKLIILPRFNVAVITKLGEIVAGHGVTYMSSVPAVWKSVLRVDKPPRKQTLRLVTCGSAPLGEPVWRGVQEWTGTKRVWNTYGITEMGSWIAGTGGDDVQPRDGLIGPGWGTRIAIAREGDPDQDHAVLDESALLPAGETGYVWLQSPTVMQGYYLQPDLTRSVMSGSWFYTGDLGYMSADGDLVLSGRVRNEINYAGIKVIPEDVDLVLERHDDVLEACTFGLADETAGEIVATAVVLAEGGSAPSVTELRSWSSQHMSDYRVPTVWFAVKDIPKTSRGKINRENVAAMCASLVRMR
jgi:acyl-CoA synthetase (AMP-forming)/AMP-acid ligase II